MISIICIVVIIVIVVININITPGQGQLPHRPAAADLRGQQLEGAFVDDHMIINNVIIII